MDMQRERANLKEEDLQNVSGGKINRKFLAGTLTGLSFFMTVPTYMPVRAAKSYTAPNIKPEFYTSYMKLYRPDDSKSPDKLDPDIRVCADKAMNKAYEVIRSAE